MNSKRYTAKKKLMYDMEKIITDFCETHTSEELELAMTNTKKILERVEKRKQERRERHDNGLRSVSAS